MALARIAIGRLPASTAPTVAVKPSAAWRIARFTTRITPACPCSGPELSVQEPAQSVSRKAILVTLTVIQVFGPNTGMPLICSHS